MAVLAKSAYGDGATVGTLLAARFGLAAGVLWVVVGVSAARRARMAALRPRDVAAGLALGAAAYAVQAGCYFAALERLDASIAALLVYTFPALVAAGAVALGRERLDARRLVALALAGAGLALVVGGAGTGRLDGAGAALALTAALLYAGYILVSDGLAARVGPLPLTTLVCTGAGVSLAAGSAALGDLRPGAVEPEGWLALGALAVVCTVGAIGAFFAGLRRVGPTTASILATGEPVVTVALAFAVFGETLAAVQLAGGALVLAAVVAVRAGAGSDRRAAGRRAARDRRSGRAPAAAVAAAADT
jgi:drug/metabolite transporter (DMT)-like permease